MSPPIGVGQATEDRDERGLAGPVRPEQAEQFPGFDLQRNAVERDGLAITLADVGDFEDRLGHGDYDTAPVPVCPCR